MKLNINKNDINDGKDVALAILAIIGLIGLIFFEAFIAMKFWNWFVVPATNFNNIKYWLTFGIMLTIGIFRTGNNKNSDDDDYFASNSCLNAFIKVLGYYAVFGIIFGIGALITLGV